MGRAPCCDKANVKRGPWSPEEDAILKAYIEKHGTGGNWIALPQKIGLKRCGKSCRLRWLNYLRPNIKHGGFTEEEDNIISSLYISIGSRWSIIAAQLPGRTDNDIKNYWNTKLKKKLLGRRNKKETNTIDRNSNDNLDHQTLSTSALERLQLHMQLLQNPNFSNFYNNNPSLWPNKLHPFQEKIIHNTLQSFNHHTSNKIMMMSSPENSGQVTGSRIGPVEPVRAEEPLDVGIQGGGDELDDILKLNNKTSSRIIMEDDAYVAPNGELYDCFGEINNNNGSLKDSLMWWSNEFDAKSALSTTSTSSHVHTQEGTMMFQDYELGYIL